MRTLSHRGSSCGPPAACTGLLPRCLCPGVLAQPLQVQNMRGTLAAYEAADGPLNQVVQLGQALSQVRGRLRSAHPGAPAIPLHILRTCPSPCQQLL